MSVSRLSLIAWLLPALLLPLPAAAQAPQPPAAIDVSAVVPRTKAPNDASEYRRIVLPNGMKVILLSDPKLNLAAASVAVGVGNLSDPPDRQGLAHYLEHMLFLGTEKYPSESEYGEYLQRNGGYNNAYTARDRTNYHLQVQPGAFEGALDRFAQFFIAPKFTPEFNEREVNAVHSEYQLNLENDGWREWALGNTLVRDGHPARNFNIGNRDTLTGTTREELLAFHDRYYSANRMTLALTGPASLDVLEKWARDYFGPVPDLKREELRYPPDYLPPKPTLRLLRMEPVKDLRTLSLSFPMPDLRPYAGSKPAELVGYVLGNEGPGSLLAALKAAGLATGLYAGAQAETHDYGSFEIGVSLTPEGLVQYPRVLSMGFAAIEHLRRNGMPPHLFAERQALAALNERYRDKGDGAELAVSLANAVMDHPLAVAERVPYLWQQADPAAVQRVLDGLRPDNLLVTLVAKGLPTDRTAPYFGTQYSYVEDDGADYQALLNPPPVSSLKLPPPNRYVPDGTQLLPAEAVRLIDDPALSLYYAQDLEFQRPLVSHELRFVLPRDLASRRNAVLLAFYDACVKESLNETLYAAYEAGYRTVVAASLEGVVLHVDGYDAAAPRLLKEIAAGLRDCPLSAERFAALKDRLLRGLAAFDNADAYMSLLETRRRAVREFHYRPDEMLPLAREVTLAQVQAFARGLYARGKLEALSLGNLSAAEAVASVRVVAEELNAKALPESQLLRRRLLGMAPGSSLLTSEQLKVNNSAYRRELLLGGDTPEMRAATAAIAAFIGPPTYSELRTRQQLGYIVFGGAGAEDNQHFAYFIVQSGDYPADVLQSRSDAFIATLGEQLKALPAEGWQTIVAGVRAKLLEKDKSVAERAARLNGLAYDEAADWQRDQATLSALQTLTQARTAEILAQALDPKTAMSRSFLGFARQHSAQQAPAVTFTDAAAWKAKQQYVR
jgi:insulysin